MRKHLKKIIALICCFTLSLGAFASLTACSSKEAKSYEIVYNLNYEGETARTVTVPSGATVVDWQLTERDTALSWWYTNADCTRKYNFSKKIGADLNLYAKWSKNADTVIVTFDGNYRGKYANTAAAVKVGDFIDETLAPRLIGSDMNLRAGIKTPNVLPNLILIREFQRMLLCMLAINAIIRYKEITKVILYLTTLR